MRGAGEYGEDGHVQEVFTKQRAGRQARRFVATEAAGLEWIGVPGGPPVPRVVDLQPTRISIQRVPEGRATAGAAEEFGRRLAALHSAGAPSFGAAPPAAPGPGGWIGNLPMPYSERSAFAEFWALDRIAATARMARDRGGLTSHEAAVVDRFVADLVGGQVDTGPPEPPARVHGDLWSGNVLWGADGQVWLIDPAAHGGHRESDLAMLALFGAPHLERILGAYVEVTPLADGWRQRIPLHQAWPLLVHSALFGGGYGASAMAAIRGAGG
jgi:fructosamine-3-kinase